MKVEDYRLFAKNGRYIRKATKVVCDDGTEVHFMACLGIKEAKRQARNLIWKEMGIGDEEPMDTREEEAREDEQPRMSMD